LTDQEQPLYRLIAEESHGRILWRICRADGAYCAVNNNFVEDRLEVPCWPTLRGWHTPDQAQAYMTKLEAGELSPTDRVTWMDRPSTIGPRRLED